MRHTRIFYKERRHRAGCKVCTVALAPLLQDTTATSKNDRPSTAWAILTHQKMRLSSSRPMSSRTAHAQTLAQEKKSAPNSCFFDRYGRAVDDIRGKPCIAAMLPAGCSAPLEDTSQRTSPFANDHRRVSNARGMQNALCPWPPSYLPACSDQTNAQLALWFLLSDRPVRTDLSITSLLLACPLSRARHC